MLSALGAWQMWRAFRKREYNYHEAVAVRKTV